MRSCGIDPLLVIAGIALWAVLSIDLLATPRLAVKLLLVHYTVLGFAGAQPRTPAGRRLS
jgi:hypothetical protein